MGRILDIMEQNAEQWPVMQTNPWDEPAEPPEEIPPAFICPVCQRPFFTEPDLRKHLAVDHSGYQTYLKVNGVVVGDVYHAPEPIQSLVLVCCGSVPGKVQVTVGGCTMAYDVSAGRSVELLRDTKLGLAEPIAVVFSALVLNPVRWTIINSALAPIDFRSVEHLMAGWQEQVRRDSPVNWDEFRAALNSPQISLVERDYLSGMYDYLYALRSEQSAADVAHHRLYEIAYGRLSQIRRPLAQTAVRQIAFKLNWFQVLAACPPLSHFYDAGMFFFALDYRSQRHEITLEHAAGLITDDADQDCLDAILGYTTNNLDLAESAISRVAASARYRRDFNLRIKVQLLQARLNRQKNAKLAKNYYREIAIVPQFGPEARDYLHANV